MNNKVEEKDASISSNTESAINKRAKEEPMRKIGLTLFVAAFLSGLILTCSGRLETREKEYYPYWNQRASHFKTLPDTEGEIIFLGDSITDGCSWTEMFQNLCVKNRGISGDTTEGVIDRLDEVLESNPDKIFLMIGINDLGGGESADQVINNIKRIVRNIQKKTPETTLILEGILPVNPDFDLFPNYMTKTQEILTVNRELKKFAKKENITYVDLYSLFVNKDNKLNPEYTNDGLHLLGSGYLIWKKAVEKYIERKGI